MNTTPNTTHPYIQHILAYTEAAAKRDFDTGASYFAPDVVYQVAGNNPISGRFTGFFTGVMVSFGKMMELSAGTYGIEEIIDWLLSDRRVLLIAKEKATVKGQTKHWTRYILFEFDAQDKICRCDILEDDQQAMDDFLNQ